MFANFKLSQAAIHNLEPDLLLTAALLTLRHELCDNCKKLMLLVSTYIYLKQATK